MGIRIGRRFDPNFRFLANSGVKQCLLGLLWKVACDIKNGVLGGLPDGVDPIFRNTSAEQGIIGFILKEQRFADGFLNVVLNNDLLDRLANFHNLRGTCSGVGIKPAPFRPIIGVVVISHLGKERVASPFVKDDPEIASYASGPESRIPAAINPVER